MKKITTLVLSGIFCAVSAFAQSEESPLTITQGTNTYEVPDYEPWVSNVVYSYSNITDRGALLTLNGETIYSINAKKGDEWIYAVSGFTKDEHIYAVGPGETILLTIYPTAEKLEFEATVNDGVNVTGGESPENAIPIAIGDVYVSWQFNPETFVTSPTYLKYTATEGGIYQLRIPTTATLGFRKGDSGEFTTLSPKMDDSFVSTFTLPLTEAGEYMLEITPTSAFVGEFIFMGNGEAGTMPETALEAQGTNDLPTAGGEWWWKFTPDESGFAVIESGAQIGKEGYSRMYDDITCTNEIQEADGCVAIRCRVKAGHTYYLNINKNETGPEEVFTVYVEPEQPGDSESNPIVISESGTYTTPKFNGTYYYSIPVPQEEDGKYLTVTTERKFEGDNTSASLRSGSQSANMVKGILRVMVSGNDTCILEWHLDEGINDIEFTVGYSEKAQGDDIETAIEATEGVNSLAAGVEKYYTYHPKINEFIGIKTANPDIHFDICTRSGMWLMQLDKFNAEGWSKARISNLREDLIYIVFEDITEATEFELKEIPFEVGDVFEFPAEAVSGTNPLPECDERYYEYTAKETGWLVIDKPETVFTTFYYMVYPSNGMDPYYTNNMDGIHTATGIKYGVTAGERYILQFSYVNEEACFTLTEESMLPGEGKETAILIEEGTIELPEDTDSMWYRYEVKECGYLDISSDIEYGDEYIGGIWKTSTLTATCEGKEEINYLYDYATDEFKGRLTVTPGETYLIHVQSVSNFNGNSLTVAKVEPEALAEGSNIMPDINAWYGYRWYVIEVPSAGDVTIASTEWSFNMDLYLPDDFSKPTASAIETGNQTSELKYSATEAGPLYLLATYVFAGTEIIYEFTPMGGVDGTTEKTIGCIAGDGLLTITAPEADAYIYTPGGDQIKSSHIIGSQNIYLPKGCYIVKVADKTFKVII